MNDLYRTIASPAEGLHKAKGSKFIALAIPVTSEEAIKSHLTALRKKYHDARHHCYAWRLGSDLDRYRVNDDGEPSGSAGKPIFGQIESRGLTQILVVVIRYFGGTLLGVGGLIQAYRTAASDALDRAKLVEKEVQARLRLRFSYAQMNEVMKVIKEYQLELEEQQFELECSVILKTWIRKEHEVIRKLKNIGGCEVIPEQEL